LSLPDCCENRTAQPKGLPERQGRTLKIILAINAMMFVVEAAAGWIARSTALLADSLDMVGDALTYGFSLFVVERSSRWKAVSSLVKGFIQLGFALSVLAVTVHKIFYPFMPSAETISVIGLLALSANAVCAFLLASHWQDDINMRSAWLCSRNDLINNLAVIGAGLAVGLTQSQWPDVGVGLMIALLFLRTSFGVIVRSVTALT
jgi:cation diffusion facilitator family transporter